MIKTKSNSFLKFSFIFIISSLTLFVVASIISSIHGASFKDVIFIEGIMLLMLSAFSSIEGSTSLPSMQEFGQINPQCFANVYLESNEIDQRRISRGSILNINVDLISSAIMFGAFISLIFSFTI
ncbi:hypothetical protein [Clostridium tertium]|uniref:DUF3899 domain-containing protein n=1 Tax=Clostridium tertium TaxID=1559 RepID=A0A6N3BYW9_9CLOT